MTLKPYDLRILKGCQCHIPLKSFSIYPHDMAPYKHLKKEKYISIVKGLSDLKSFKYTELKDELKLHNLKVSGKKEILVERLYKDVGFHKISKKFIEDFYEITEKGLKELENNKFYFYCQDTKYYLHDKDIVNAIQQYNLYPYSEGDELLYKEIIWEALNEKYKKCYELNDIAELSRDIGNIIYEDGIYKEALYYFTKAIMAHILSDNWFCGNLCKKLLLKIFKIIETLNITTDEYFKFIDSFMPKSHNNTLYGSSSNVRRYKDEFIHRYEKQLKLSFRTHSRK